MTRAALARAGGGAATPVVGGEAMASSSSNTAGALVRGINPETIGDVIDLKENIEVGSFDYFTGPEKLLELGPDEIVGRGPGGEPYFHGPDFRNAPDTDPSLREFIEQNEKIYPASSSAASSAGRSTCSSATRSRCSGPWASSARWG